MAPTFWLNPKNGVSYPIVIQTPQYQLDTLHALKNIPITGSSNAAQLQILGGISDIYRENTDAVVSHYAIQPAFDVYATTQDRDLGGVAADIQRVLNDDPARRAAWRHGDHPRPGPDHESGLLRPVLRPRRGGRADLSAYRRQFPFLVRSLRDRHGVAAALAGIVWTLFATHTTLSVPALTGAIMCMGVATANSILVVSFARERLEATGDAVKAAIEAGVTRFRPVLMTALAMIIGMAPMALGLGEGGEQNAPLGRAVIGGLFLLPSRPCFLCRRCSRWCAVGPARRHALVEKFMSPQNDCHAPRWTDRDARNLKRAAIIGGCAAGRDRRCIGATPAFPRPARGQAGPGRRISPPSR